MAKLDRLMDLVAAAHTTPPDLVIWPESATPRGMFSDDTNHRFTIRQTARTGTPLLLGSLEPGDTPDDDGHLPAYNSAILVGADKDAPLQSYRKRHLVPFGEFLPFRDWLPEWVRELVPGDLEPGREANLLHLSTAQKRIGALVCFEDSLAPETRALAREGAQLLVNLTNDAWFGKSAAAQQHLANAKFRAVETRLPLLRCANTGMTCHIDSLGRVEQQLDPFTEGMMSVSVPVMEAPVQTLYTRWGDRWIILCAAFGLLLAREQLRPRAPADDERAAHQHG
jgi:apolipoprotein N-acyltransferase